MSFPALAPAPVQSTTPLDRRQRPVHDLRLSVIERCNLRCRYCLPAETFGPDYAFLPEKALLSVNGLYKMAAAAVELGARKVRLTGGEPLLRRDLPEIVARIAGLDLDDLALTTNGIALARLAPILKTAGLQRVNVSLDALDPEVLAQVAGRQIDPSIILRGISAAQAAGLGVKVNTVIQRGLNDDQVLPLARWGRREGITIRFIEYMDVGNQNRWDRSQVYSGREALETLEREWPLVPVEPAYAGEVARRYRYADGAGEIGLINSITQPFCGNCSRLRVTARGEVLTCLFAQRGLSVRHWVEDPLMTSDDLAFHLRRLWAKRSDAYSEQRQSATAPQTKREMWEIGG
ncbi:MAG: GTP 3',8-cyclase MoaA [Verrucomicrobiota bacterium JB022]|nr:GTP 3',8-cyclase MoaA [Verrucomicrobiota bacterium JB022]